MFSVYQSILQIKYVIDAIDEIRGGKYMDAVIEILKGLDYSPLYVSLKTGIVATIFSFFLGLFAARKVIKAGPKVKAIADGILTLPMVLPPTAAGSVSYTHLTLPTTERV